MSMKQVQVLEATKAAPNSKGRRTAGIQIERIRVAAYCRVSTDGDEQLGSFESQKAYYEQKIKQNKEWVSAGIFADEAITGTKVDKREGFQEMIRKCQNGEIDMILTKSISRFSRNTQDIIKYVRMLRDRNIAIVFEKENINTLDMNGEMLLTILSSLSQGEVESLSENVKMGLKMKMKRGELVGFNGCLGYDYHPDTKSITVNEQEAETVRFIYDMYLQGYGSSTIAKRLTEMGVKNKRGTVEWHDHGVMGIIKNEKYKGDILLGKTFTVDPISKRRLANMGEEDRYYIRDHHEPIVSREVWDKADEIRLKRVKPRLMENTGNRERYTRQFTFSSMLECGYCDHKLSRRTRHQTTTTKKPVWQCMNAIKNGISSCPNCKAIDEVIVENAFVDAFQLLADNFDDVFDSVLNTIEDVLKDDTELKRVKQLEKDINSIETKKSRLTDLLIDGKIEQEDYDEKKLSFQRKLHQMTEEKAYLEENIGQQKNVSKRMDQLRKTLENEDILDEFDRIVFESIVEKVIVGGYDENGNLSPYKLTFVLKCNQDLKVNDAKAEYRSKQKGKKVS
ncbi:Transposon Tn1000 resolvase [Allocoprococcus comes]|uniref:Transposon Tn1000 resolvase n=1 Tax=Coprococcus comes TaxID=410072 RepID=A0A173X2V8_9FIRM|nr:recombinase family protein [Coprococcus comes]CUN46122.1 Transposon Tn1000 resolvase [Coprococcus comes]